MVSNLFISARLKEKREELHLKQDQVAQLVGVNRNAISTYENGTREPSLGMMVRLARLYRVSTDYLLTGKEMSNERRRLLSVISELTEIAQTL